MHTVLSSLTILHLSIKKKFKCHAYYLTLHYCNNSETVSTMNLREFLM